MILKRLTIAMVALPLAVVAAGQLGLLAGSPPEPMGVAGGRLREPSYTPNSVSSQAALYPLHSQRAYAAIDPLKFSGDGIAAMRQLAGVLRTLDGIAIVEQSEDYLRAESSTRVLKFKDDLEFWLDPSGGVIHFRSASRLGRKDFGVNRDRMETIRSRFQIQS